MRFILILLSTLLSFTVYAESIPKYKRSYFGDGWADTDRDCKSTRHEVLADLSTSPPKYKTNKQCRVLSGRWISMFTGAQHFNARVLDIDHVVPLAWAWYHGAYAWGESQRISFSNDVANLIPVEAKLNRQKSAKGPDRWVPPANKCQYIARFLRVVKKYGLELTAKELRSYRQKLSNFQCHKKRASL